MGLPVSAQALGMGVPILKSHLNETLDVRVPLLLAEGENLNNISIEFAKPNEYRLVGLEPYTDLSILRVSVEHTQHGELYIFLSSVSAVQAPMMSLLLKARIGYNTYYKQVQILLDSMALGAETHAVKAHPNSLPPRLNDAPTKVATDVEQYQGWARTWRYGPVRSGDSLSTIAYRLRRDQQWSNHDIMLALYRLNTSAFINHDINRLKSGVWLEVPREDVLKKLLKQSPSPLENIHQQSSLHPKKTAKIAPKPEIAPPTDNAGLQLRYVGRIGLGNDAAKHPLDGNIDATSKRSVQLQKQLDQLYKQAMNDHLKMASLDQNLTSIRDDIHKLTRDISAVKEQQNAMQQAAQTSTSTYYWMLGFLLLCLFNIILLGTFLYHRYALKKKDEYDISEVYFGKKVNNPAPIKEPKTTPVTKKVRKEDPFEKKIFNLENYLNLNDYEAAENILKTLNESELHHIGISALHARFYYETERLDELDNLILNKKVILNKREWSLLCDRLSINIWRALCKSGVVKDNGTLLSDKDSLIYDGNKTTSEVDLLKKENIAQELQLDDTVIMNTSDLKAFLEGNRIEDGSSSSTLTPKVAHTENDDLALNDINLDIIGDYTTEESLLEDDITTGAQKKS